MDELEKMAKGYIWADTEEYLADQRIAKDLVYDFNHSRPTDEAARQEIIRKLFKSVGENVFIAQPMYLGRGTQVTIGSNCYINFNMTLVDDYEITIGDNCLFAPNVMITTTGHAVDPELRKKGMYSFPVRIGNNVWLGMGAIILPGVTIGDNSVIGAGSVVTHDIPANVIAMGSPCKVVREIGERDKEYYYRNLRVADLPQD